MTCLRTAVLLVLAGLLPAANAAAPAFLNAASDHFDLYTTDTEAAARAALDHFETARLFLIRRVGGVDPFPQSVRIVGFRSNNEYRSHMPNIEAEHAFSKINGDAVTIEVDTLKPTAYEYAMREYVNLLVARAAPNIPYWLRMGFRELYSTMKTGNGEIRVGEDPYMEKRASLGEPSTTFLTLLFGLTAGSTWGDSAEAVHASNKFIALGGLDSTLSVGVDPSYRLTALHLTRMLMFDKNYSPKFNAFVSALTGGADTIAALKTVYGQSLADVVTVLRLEMIGASHPAWTVKLALPGELNPRIAHISVEDSAALIAEIKSRK